MFHKRYCMKKTSVILFLFLMSSVGFAANWDGKTARYVCDTAVCGQTPGAGTSWSNATDDLPATLVRDYVYYVADGNYSDYIFDDDVEDEQDLFPNANN